MGDAEMVSICEAKLSQNVMSTGRDYVVAPTAWIETAPAGVDTQRAVRAARRAARARETPLMLLQPHDDAFCQCTYAS